MLGAVWGPSAAQCYRTGPSLGGRSMGSSSQKSWLAVACALRGIPHPAPAALSLMAQVSPQVIELPVTERQIEREHLIQLKKWRETHGELQCKSPPRLHGAKAISEAEPAPRKALEPVPSIIVSPGPAPVPKARKSKEKSREKGPASPANGPGAEGNGAPGTTRELLHPQVSPHHQSKESLSSRESEDTYL